MQEEFFQMIKEWIIKDYYNPSIKAEVMWDTMLSEFVCDLVFYQVSCNKNHYKNNITKAIKRSDFVLLAKEFPINNAEAQVAGSLVDEKTNLHSAKIDYLVGDRFGNLYFIELKTTNDSFDRIQYYRYLEYSNCGNETHAVNNNSDKKRRSFTEGIRSKDNKYFWDFYKSIIERNANKSINKKNEDIEGSQKYYFQIDFIKNAAKKLGLSFDGNLTNVECVNLLAEKFRGQVNVLYLTLHAIDYSEVNKACQIVLENVCADSSFDSSYMEEGHFEKWEATKDIINDVIAYGKKSYEKI